MSFRPSIALFVALFVATTASAAPVPAGIEARMAELMPGVTADGVREMPLAGLYEVRIGAGVLYMTGDGRYAVQGRVLDLEADRNLTDEAQTIGRREIMAGLKDSDLVVYSPKNPRHTITVFTDIDCPYCRKLHEELPELNRLGIKVRYAAYPRAGVGSSSYRKAVNVWCAKDRKTAMTDSKAGKKIEDRECGNPVADQFKLGGKVGVSGTPTIVLEGGEVIPGYRPAAEIAAIVEQVAEARKQKGQ